MIRSSLLALGLLVFSTNVRAQTNPDSQTLQSILNELKLLRQELRTTSATAQRAQILFYRLQLQESVVRQLQERVDDARSKVAQAQREIKMYATGIKNHEDQLQQADNEVTRRQMDTIISQLRASSEMQAGVEQEYQIKLTDGEDQLRTEKANLARLQDELDRLDRSLSPAAK